ncbi:MAG: hypothetical protein HYU77_08635 [Betaproteobacteria bacterium]|nr:hypothetical protein [Betaproteobacteria bacterium]
MAAHGTGMGRLTVNSALGEPLKAEVELLSVKKDEIPSVSARVATPEQFKQAGLDFGAIHSRLKLSVEVRADGQPYIRIISDQPVREPFVALLVELSWSSGRLLREYTFLLDPPGFDAQKPLAPVAKPAAPVTPPVAVAPEKPKAGAPVAAPAGEPAAAPTRPEAAPREPAANTYGPVKRGDNLSRIAVGVRPEGVSLDQMLVALYRANREAFMGNNMNRLRTGPILRVPDASELASVDAKEARREVRTQASDWNAYKQKLAAVAATGAPGAPAQQIAAGKITTAVEDKAAAREPAKEVLKLSKGEAPGDKAAGARDAKALQARVRAMEEDATARDKALREAKERIALLEKNIKDMQKLAEIKSQPLAKAQEAAKPVQPTPAAPAAKPEAPKPEAAKPAEPAKPVEAAKPAEAPKPEAAKPAPPKPTPKPAAAPPPPPEKSLIEEFLDNPIYIGVIVVALLILVGVGFLALRREKKVSAPAVEAAEEMKTMIVPAAAAGIAAAPGPAAEAEARAAPPSEEVDPIAEAEVYLTYGRDTQAEEILKDALAKDASRAEVQVKLLEIYANRKDKAACEAAAKRFQAAGGAGPVWERVINMGIVLDPANPLYAGGIAAAPAPQAAEAAAEAAAPGKVDFDFDLDLGAPAAAPQPAAAPEAPAKAETMAMDFDITALGGEAPAAAPAAAAPAPAAEEIVFDITVPPAAETPAAAPAPAESSADAGIEFKLDTGDAGAAPAAPAASELSLGDISLDLGEPRAAPGGDGEGHDAHWQEVATKFDLAKAYQEMGDKDGAREILQEVLREGDAQQQEAAKALLATL